MSTKKMWVDKASMETGVEYQVKKRMEGGAVWIIARFVEKKDADKFLEGATK